MFRLSNLLFLTFLTLIMATFSDCINRSKRTLNNPMKSAEGQSNLYQVPWFGPPLPGFGAAPGFPFYIPPPPSPQQIFDRVRAFQSQVKQNMDKQLDQMKQNNDCEPTEVYTEDYSFGGKNYTYTRKTCKTDGSSSNSGSLQAPSSGSNPGSGSGSGSGSSSGSGSGSFAGSSSGSGSGSFAGSSPGSGSGSSSGSGSYAGSSPSGTSSSSSSSYPSSDQNSGSSSSTSNQDSNSGQVASAVASSGTDSNGGGGVATASSSGR